jgi:capsular polysaccharide biosynthesis protein
MAKVAKVQYSKIIKRRWGFVTVVTLVVVLISLIFSLIQPFEYQSEVKILVIQKSAVSIDAYSASKSAERIGRNLGQIIYSSSFFSQILNAGFGIDQSYFPDDEDKRRKQWQKMIATEVPANTTILQIKVFHTDRDQATQIAKAIAYVLDQKAEEYVGIPDIDLKIVDAPLTSNLPVKPNFILNTALGLVLGFFIAIAALLISYSEDETAHEVFHHGLPPKAVDQPAPITRPQVQPTKAAEPSEPPMELPKVSFEGEEQEYHEEHGEVTEHVQPGYENLPEFQEEDNIRTIDSAS